MTDAIIKRKDGAMNILVDNFLVVVAEEDARQAFETFGQLEFITIRKNQYTGEAIRFGFIDIPAETEAQSTINLLGINK
jgi:hypothetical protein